MFGVARKPRNTSKPFCKFCMISSCQRAVPLPPRERLGLAAQLAVCIADKSSDSGARQTQDFWEVRHSPEGLREYKQMFEVERIRSQSRI